MATDRCEEQVTLTINTATLMGSFVSNKTTNALTILQTHYVPSML